jgi:hypothetical protein
MTSPPTASAILWDFPEDGCFFHFKALSAEKELPGCNLRITVVTFVSFSSHLAG